MTPDNAGGTAPASKRLDSSSSGWRLTGGARALKAQVNDSAIRILAWRRRRGCCTALAGHLLRDADGCGASRPRTDCDRPQHQGRSSSNASAPKRDARYATEIAGRLRVERKLDPQSASSRNHRTLPGRSARGGPFTRWACMRNRVDPRAFVPPAAVGFACGTNDYLDAYSGHRGHRGCVVRSSNERTCRGDG